MKLSENAIADIGHGSAPLNNTTVWHNLKGYFPTVNKKP